MQSGWLALFLHDLTNYYQLMLRDDAEKTARRFDHTVSVYSAEKSAQLQVRQIQSVLSESKGKWPTAMLVCPVRESALINVLADSVSNHIPWIYLCRWSEQLQSARRSDRTLPIFSVAADQTEIGRMQGRILKRLVGPDTEIVYIQGPYGTSSTSRRSAATRQELADFVGLRWSAFNSDWSVEGGRRTMNDWLASIGTGAPRDFVVCAQNDDMAFGARKALIDGKHSVSGNQAMIVGCDGLANFGRRLVTEGQLTATVVVPPVAGRAIEELFVAQRGGAIPPEELTVRVECHPRLERIQRP